MMMMMTMSLLSNHGSKVKPKTPASHPGHTSCSMSCLENAHAFPPVVVVAFRWACTWPSDQIKRRPMK